MNEKELRNQAEMEKALQQLADSHGLDLRMNDYKIPDPELNFEHVLNACLKKIELASPGETPFLIIPVQEFIGTKKNKVRVLKEDPTSPMGVVQKHDAYAAMMYNPHASAAFNAYDLARWAALKIGPKNGEAE